MRRSWALGTLLAVTATMALPETAALAADDDELSVSTPARFVMGVKFGGGGTLWSEPDSTVITRDIDDDDPTWELPIFNETRGGWTATSGLFIEGIFFDYFGLEIGAHFVQHNLIEKVDWTYTKTTTVNNVPTRETDEATSDQELSWTALHLPILVKAIVPSRSTRISLGIGPEFAFGSWAKTKFSVRESTVTDPVTNELNLPGPRGELRTIMAKLEDSIYLNVVFGLEIIVGDNLVIPVDISWSYNFSQENDYLQRAALDRFPGSGQKQEGNHPTELTLKTRDDMYGVIRVGLAYQFD